VAGPLDPCFPGISCLWEASARKVGNVHPGAAFGDTNYYQFAMSALALDRAFGKPNRGIGEIIHAAVSGTREIVGRNTNLGMALLLAPLAKAGFEVRRIGHPEAGDLDSDTVPLTGRTGEPLRDALVQALNETDEGDCLWVYRAIRLAHPGGLGDAPEQDVRDEPTVTLLEAMKLAAERDQLARQYANGFADVFDFGVPAFLEGWETFGTIEAAIIHSQLRWLETHPDSLIARKNGPAAAEDVRQRAAEVRRLGGITTPGGRRAGIALDRFLRSDGNKLNPGATADLIAACLFVTLHEGRVKPSDPFKWETDEWL
jgi:triphosphoribosyl-dephospho-CoA synthase